MSIMSIISKSPREVLDKLNDIYQFNNVIIIKETKWDLVVHITKEEDVNWIIKITSNKYVSEEVTIMNNLRDIVPVPLVIQYQSGGDLGIFSFIITEYIKDSVPMDLCTCVNHEKINEQIKYYIGEMRKVKIPGLKFRLKDPYFTICTGTILDYHGINDFMSQRLQRFIDGLSEYPLVLSHCDLWPRNILLSSNGEEIKAIIDWEFAGFYPDFYEYYKYRHDIMENIADEFPGFNAQNWILMFKTDSADQMLLLEDEIVKKYDLIAKYIE